MAHAVGGRETPRVLVFSTNAISDMGIDFARSAQMDYPPTVQVIALPCSGGIRPEGIVHALTSGFAGVFVAADGPECSCAACSPAAASVRSSRSGPAR